MHLLIILQGLSKSVEDNPSISTELSIPVIGAFSESNRWIYNMAKWLEKSAWLTGTWRGVQAQNQARGLVFWALGKLKEPSHQSKGRGDAGTLGTTANQNQACQLPAPSNTKKDVVCKDVPLLGDTAKEKKCFSWQFYWIRSWNAFSPFENTLEKEMPTP